MNIEIKVAGRNAEEVREALKDIASQFGLSLGSDGVSHAPAPIDELDLDTLVNETKRRLNNEGFTFSVEAVEKVAIKKSVRKAVVETAPEPETDVKEDPAEEKKKLEKLKEDTISKLQALYLETGGADRVKALLKKYAPGEKVFSKVPAEAFIDIAKELEDGANG